MDWWTLISRVAVVLVVAVTLQIYQARLYRRRMARLEAIRGDWDRETRWVGVIMRGIENGGPPAAVCETWSGYYGGKAS
jgi:hypothetical protein